MIEKLEQLSDEELRYVYLEAYVFNKTGTLNENCLFSNLIEKEATVLSGFNVYINVLSECAKRFYLENKTPLIMSDIDTGRRIWSEIKEYLENKYDNITGMYLPLKEAPTHYSEHDGYFQINKTETIYINAWYNSDIHQFDCDIYFSVNLSNVSDEYKNDIIHDISKIVNQYTNWRTILYSEEA